MTFGVNFAAIFDAFQRFVNAPFQEKRGILEHEQHLLLINSADILVTAHIEKKRNSADQNERELADALDAYRDVLRRSRKRGIASAWAKFEATYSTVKHRPLEKEQQHRFIHNEKRKFDDMISEAEHRGHSEESGLSNQLKTMRDLLQQAQEVGIIAAWEELEAWKNVVAQIEQQASYLEVREAILSLVTASPQQIREIFEQKQHLLLVDGSVELINLLTQEAQQKDETDIANQLANIGRLVQQAHEVGIAPILQALDTMDISFVKHIPPSILPTLFAAVGDFIHAHGADEIRSVIEHHRDLLLNDDAESVLRQYIKDAKRQNQDQSLIELFERSLIVLRTIRHAGLEAAMALLNATAHSNDIVTEMGPTDAAPQDIQATILQWGSIRNYREQRRFLEAHLELLDAGLEAHLQIMFERDRMHEEVLREEEKWISPTDAQVMQMIRERITLIRDIRSRGGTIQAIRDRYINAFTGFALDLPDWLEPIEEQYQLLVERDDSSEKLSPVIQQMLVDLFRPALARAQQEASLAPEILAEIYTRLGQSLSSIDSIHQNEAIEEAIPYLEAALAVYTAEQYPQCWAHGQYCLAGAYFSRISNDRQDNLERARRASESALLFITREIDPSIWAELQQNLGTIYQERNSGDLDENLERSIEYYNASLTVFVRDTYPLAWAQTQSSLGGVYHKRAKGRKKEDQQLAVTYHEAALEIFTREQFPLQWAQIWSNLNILLHEKVSDNPSKEEDLQSIIAKEKEVLEVFSREHFPKRWANTQNNLGALFADLATGDPDTVLAQAFQHWEAALQVRTRAAFPLEFQHTHLNMAQTAHWIIANRALEQGNEQAVRDAYALAHQHYLLAREVQADFGWLTTNPQARAILQGSVNDMYLRDAWCLVQIGDLLGAIVALEAGRAQALAEAQAIAGTQLDGVCEVHRDQFMTVGRNCKALIRVMIDL
jgi:hypothetical protein